MPSNGHKRVELADGNWVDVRTKQTLADIEALEKARHDRGGYASEALDMLVVVGRVITAWSYDDELTPENVKEVIDVRDLAAIGEAMVTDPNSLRPSSDGTEQERAVELLPVAGDSAE